MPSPEPLPDASDEVLLLHNPSCSKSRATRALLVERGIAFRERRYLEDPLRAEELRELVRRLGVDDLSWVRTGERAWDDAAGAGEHPAELVERHPELLQRPIVVRGARAAIGRPPEAVLTLFEG